MTKDTNLIGKRADGWNLGLAYMVQNGRTWALVGVDEDKVITEVYCTGARAKIQQEGAKMCGKLVLFWYECMVELHSRTIKLTPMQVSNIARLTYSEMVQLNNDIGECGKLPERFNMTA